MGRKSYNDGHLVQCVRNLFAKARVEFDTLHDIRAKFTEAIAKDIPAKSMVISRWNEEEDCFTATSLTVWRIEGSKILIEFAVYVDYSDYKSTIGVGVVDTPDEVFEWLDKEESFEKCINKVDDMISWID